MDHRDIQSRTSHWYDSFNENQMLATIDELEVNDEIIDVSVSCIFQVCPTCDGKGHHVNPSIDSNGITAEEWNRDWSHEDRENYITGFYDIDCYECCGKRVVPIPDKYTNKPEILKAIEDAEHAEYIYACERIREVEMGY